MNRERLALLSVVRGLEALEQPSQVSLVTTSRYVSRGLRYGLSSWRESDYTWERFGEQRPVRNSDLWRRVDTALQFHGIKCRLIQAGPSNPELQQPEAVNPEATGLAATSQRAACSGLLTAESLGDARYAETMPGPAKPWRPTKTRGNLTYQRSNWWNLAAAWIRWWRGRLQNRHAVYGT